MVQAAQSYDLTIRMLSFLMCVGVFGDSWRKIRNSLNKLSSELPEGVAEFQ